MKRRPEPYAHSEVEEDARPAGEREDREKQPDDVGVDVQLLRDTGAHAGDDTIVAVELERRH